MASSVDRAMITIRIGKGSQMSSFTVPEKVIRASSLFIDTAMKGPWLESQERVISLPDYNHETFGIYFQWLLTGKLHSKQHLDAGDRVSESLVEFRLLRKLSDMGHYLLDTDFRDIVNDGIVQCSMDYQGISVSYSSDFYDTIPSESPTRRLVTDIVAWTASIYGFEYADVRYRFITFNPDFVWDMLQAMASRFMSHTPGKSPLEDWEMSCKYHCHGDEKPCYREKSKRYADSPHDHSGVLY
jgi:hypothetical protein